MKFDSWYDFNNSKNFYIIPSFGNNRTDWIILWIFVCVKRWNYDNLNVINLEKESYKL